LKMGRNIEDVRLTLGGTRAIDDIRKEIESFLFLIRGAFAGGVLMNLGKFGESNMSMIIPKAKTIISGSNPPDEIVVNITKKGGAEKHYISGRHPIPLALVMPLWECTPRILEEAEKNPATREEMETYRRAGLLHLQAQLKAIQSGDHADRGCANCNAVTAHIVVRGSSTLLEGGGGRTHHLRWRCLTCRAEVSTDSTEVGQV
jgi:hypothetical protein